MLLIAISVTLANITLPAGRRSVTGIRKAEDTAYPTRYALNTTAACELVIPHSSPTNGMDAI